MKNDRWITVVILLLVTVGGGILLSLHGHVSRLQVSQEALSAELAELRKTEEERRSAGSDTFAPSVETTLQENVNIKLSPYLYAAPGMELNIYFDNIIDGKDINYDFNVICEIGALYDGYYRVIPNITSGGGYPLTVQVVDHGRVIDQAETQLLVAKPLGEARALRCMVIGDSIVATNYLLPLLKKDLDAIGAEVEFLGTQGEMPCFHEGRGGWTADRYLHHNDSPFVFDGVFDFSQYMKESDYERIDYVFIVLGINDFFHEQNLDVTDKIQETLEYYHKIIDGIRAYDETIRIGLCVTIPPAYTEDAFGDWYGTTRPRWSYKLINFAWMSAMIDEFANADVDLVPINVNLDTKNNMGSREIRLNTHNSAVRTIPARGGYVHPDESGYWQLADEICCYIQYMETEIEKEMSD